MAEEVNLITIRNRIADLLKDHEHLRDNDHALAAEVWKQECFKCNVKKLSDFFYMLSIGDVFTNFESIRRNRQLLQAEFTSLRGKNYGHRKKHEKNVVDQINHNKNFPPEAITNQSVLFENDKL